MFRCPLNGFWFAFYYDPLERSLSTLRDDGDHFGWWFKFGESWPCGQLSSLMVLSELGELGAWSRVFNQPNLAKFSEPTASGVDHPTLGIFQCWNEANAGALPRSYG